MSEQNILNPAGSDLNPDFPLPMPGTNAPLSVFQPRSGPPIKRIQAEAGRIIPLTWTKRARSVRDRLVQWEAQYKTGFFSFYHAELDRYFTGSFADNLQPVQVGYEQWNISGTFMEMPGVPMFVYPTNWNRDAIFLEERDDFGNDRVKLTGAWFLNASGNEHAGRAYVSGTLNSTAEWEYVGYGFRVWSRKDVDCGDVEISLDGTVLGLNNNYNAVVLASLPDFVKADVPLGRHRVKLRVTNLKDAASSGFQVFADAIEVMQ
ncbi:MAG: hypothetical protein JWN45_1811 [Acidobacteriaceae bacterium]|nr:hypothetical protein [Acidobacteriaceae bacterium]